MSDGSIPTKLEEWAVTTLNAANTGSPKVFDDIAQYDGTTDQSGARIAEEITAHRARVARVFVLDHFHRKDSDSPQDRFYDLYVLIGLRNERGGIEARCGDATFVGMHRAMEWVTDLLLDAHPGVVNGANNRKATLVTEARGQMIVEKAGLYVSAMIFQVRAEPK